MFKKYIYRYPLSVGVLCAIVGLSLYPFTEIQPLPDVPLADKWAHMVMYGVWCSVIWFEYLRKHRKIGVLRMVVGAMVLPIAVGGILELLQENLTATRNGDMIDFYANTLGVLLGNLTGRIVVSPLARKMGLHPKD